MPLSGEYAPSPKDWVREQVAEYEASGGRLANTLRDTGLPVVIVTHRGAKSGKLHKTPLMRVEHGGDYALVGSSGGSPADPQWVHNLVAHPGDVMIQDGPQPFDATVHVATGAERAIWWERSVAAYPNYVELQARTEREIPVFVASPTTH